jgi:hypothetical protein
MSLWTKVKCLSVEDKKVLYHPQLPVPSGEISCKVVQTARSKRMPCWAKVEGFSIEDNGLIKVLHLPELLEPNGEMNCKAA